MSALPAVVAVTGASGRLGRRIVRRLLEEPGVERIVAIDRAAPPAPRRSAGDDARVQLVRADVRDPDFDAHLRGCAALVHLAFIVERGSRDEREVEAINVGGTRNVMEAAARAGVERVAYASSIGAYGFHADNAGRELDEDAPTRGNDSFYYPRTKAAVEHWLDDFERRTPRVAIARLRPTMFLSDTGYGGLLRQPLFPYLMGPHVPMHVTHERDVAEAFVAALAKGARGAYNVATTEPLAVAEWPRQMGKLGIPIPRTALGALQLLYRAGVGPVDPAWISVGSGLPLLVSSKKIRRELGWRPLYETTAMVLRAIAGAPSARASAGVRLFLGSLATVTALRGGLPVPADQRHELRGVAGAANLVLTGDRASEWHMTFAAGAVGLNRGLDPRARASVAMNEDVFVDLLSGRLNWSRATATGRVRYHGQADYGLFVAGLVGSFRRLLADGGGLGLPGRLFARLVLLGARRGPSPAATDERPA